MHTENEIILNSRLQVDTLVSALKRKKVALEDVGDLIPGFVHLNDCENHQMTYLNNNGQKEWETSLVEIKDRGIDWLLDICHKDVLKQSFNKIEKFNKTDDGNGLLSYYQFVRKPSNLEYAWYFTSKKRFDKDCYISITHNIAQFGSAARVINDILDDNLVLKKNHQRFHTLSNSEKAILRLIAEGNRSKDISDILHISTHTVNTHRKNIWSKMDIKSYAELHRIANAFDLIDD